MKIEILYLDGCPNHRPAVERIQTILREEGISASVSEIEIRDQEAAMELGFPGSPTIRVDGLDIEPAFRAIGDFRLPFQAHRTFPRTTPQASLHFSNFDLFLRLIGNSFKDFNLRATLTGNKYQAFSGTT